MKQLLSRPFLPLMVFLVALAAAVVISSWFLKQWQQQQTSIQTQLLSHSASLLSVQPLLQNQPAALEVTLHALQQHSTLPIQAMAVFDQSQRLFASTNQSESWLEQAAQSFDHEHTALSDSAFQLISTPIWVDRTSANLAIANQTPAPAVTSRQLGYLLIMLDKSPTPLFRVLSPILILLVLSFGLIGITIQRMRHWQRQQIQQMAALLQQDELAQTGSNPLMLPLVTAWQQRIQWIQRQADAVTLELQTRLQQLDAQLLLSQQNTTVLSSKHQQVVGQLQKAQQQLHDWRQLEHYAAQQTPTQLLHRIKLLALYSKLSDAEFCLQPDAVLIPHWLQDCYQQHLEQPGASHQFLFAEDPQAFAFKVNLDPELLAHLLALLATMSRQLATEPEIIISYRLVELPQKQLRVNIKFVGRIFPVRWRQVLAAGVTDMQPEDLEAAVCYRILQKLQGELHIDSIEDVGTQFELMLPVSWQKTNASKLFQSILLVDEKECRLPLAKQGLTALGEQVHCCHAFSQLQDTLQRRLVDLLVLVLPDDPTKFDVSDEELSLLLQRYQVRVLASAAAVANWQTRLSFPVSTMPLLIGALSVPQPQLLAQQQLLVVDDNPTNLSYVRAVLALEGLRIDIAMTGEEAIRMAANNRYQLILMDIQLPDLPGTEVTKQIRQLRHHQRTVILAFTAHALADEIAGFRLAGMDDVLIKPLDTQKIAHILGRIKALDQS